MRGEASVHSKIGDYYFKTNDYTSAINAYERSVSIYKTLNQESKLASAYLSIGKCYANLDNYQKAFEYFEKSVGHHLEINDKMGIAEFYVLLKQFDRAIELLHNILDDTKEKHLFKCLAYVLISISLFSLDKEKEAHMYIKDLIQYHSINKYAKVDWDFSDIIQIVDEMKSPQSILVKDLVSLIQNKTAYPIIRFDNINIEQEVYKNCAEVFHPFIGRKTIIKDDETLTKIIKNLIDKGNIEIDIDKSSIMGVERDNAIMILGFLYKKGRINFIEIAPNNLKIGLTDHGRKIKLTSE